MPASTSDPISSVLQRTFGDHKKEGLIRGGNSSSARPFSFIDQKLQASSKHSLLGGIQFDAPTRTDVSPSGGCKTPTQQRVIVLNPQLKVEASGKNGSEQASENGSSNSSAAIPQPKVTFFSPSEVEVGYTNIRSAGAGMANVGNTCYLNSTLQALFHTPALFNYLQNSCSSQHMSRCSSSSIANGFLQSCIVCALAHTLRDTLRANIIRPNRIYEKLKLICKHMVQGRQEDAHEFLRYLIDSLQRSYLNSVQASKSLDTASKETTPFNQIFGGYMRQDVTCLKCKYVSTTFQHFMDILVDIRQASTIEEALQHFFRQEKLGHVGDEASLYKCEKCKIKVPAKRRCYIERPPAVLCIQLKRFSLLGGKIGKPVQLSRNLNVAPFIYPQNASCQINAVQYKLVSMITHVGPSPNCGHYTAIGEAANGQFFQFDDASVRAIPLNQVLNTASYVVFYEMTRSSWANQAIKPTTSQHSQVRPTPPTQKLITIDTKPSLDNSLAVMNRPKIIGANGIVVNKLGVVSSAAKHIVAAAADVAKSVVSSGQCGSKTNGTTFKANGRGLVPYDDDDEPETSCSDTKPIAAKALPSFVPRSVSIKSINEKAATCSSPQPLKATNRNWTVTDVDHHNPSIHSDNSTGSTGGHWVVTPQSQTSTARPSSAMSEESASSSKWTVTPLQKAIEEESTSSHAPATTSSASGPSTPTSYSSSSTSSSSSCVKRKIDSNDENREKFSRKRPSVDERPENDYDAELDRGRTKKIKRHDYSPPRKSGDNPFQAHQDRQNQHRQSSYGRSQSLSTPPSFRHRNHWEHDNRQNRSRDYRYRDNNYHSNDQRYYNNYRDKQQHNSRRLSYGGNGTHDRGFSSSNGYSSNHHRDSYRRRR